MSNNNMLIEVTPDQFLDHLISGKVANPNWDTNMKVRDSAGQTILHKLAKNQSSKSQELLQRVSKLPSAKSIVDVQDNEGNTAMIVAVKSGNQSAAQILDSVMGANLKLANKKGFVVSSESDADADSDERMASATLTVFAKDEKQVGPPQQLMKKLGDFLKEEKKREREGSTVTTILIDTNTAADISKPKINADSSLNTESTLDEKKFLQQLVDVFQIDQAGGKKRKTSKRKSSKRKSSKSKSSRRKRSKGSRRKASKVQREKTEVNIKYDNLLEKIMNKRGVDRNEAFLVRSAIFEKIKKDKFSEVEDRDERFKKVVDEMEKHLDKYLDGITTEDITSSLERIQSGKERRKEKRHKKREERKSKRKSSTSSAGTRDSDTSTCPLTSDSSTTAKKAKKAPAKKTAAKKTSKKEKSRVRRY